MAKPTNPIELIRREADMMSPQFGQALPSHIPVERFARVILTAVQLNDYLLKCDRRSLWASAMKAANDGLLPDGKEGALVPFKGKVQWVPMVAGIRKKARNSGEIATWETEVFCENDKFDFQLGDDPFILHKPELDDRGKPVGAYSIATLKSGEKSREVMGATAIYKIRDRSEGWKSFKAGKTKSSPWQTDEEEMFRKTVAKRHAKVLPTSTDLDDVLRRDDELYNHEAASDRKVKQETLGSRAAAALSQNRPDTLPAVGDGGTVDDIDTETGEVISDKPAEKPAEKKAAAKPKQQAASKTSVKPADDQTAKKAPANEEAGANKAADAEQGDGGGEDQNAEATENGESGPDGGTADSDDPTRAELLAEARQKGVKNRGMGMARDVVPRRFSEDEELRAAYEAGWDADG